jgi:hypothetical protein
MLNCNVCYYVVKRILNFYSGNSSQHVLAIIERKFIVQILYIISKINMQLSSCLPRRVTLITVRGTRLNFSTVHLVYCINVRFTKATRQIEYCDTTIDINPTIIPCDNQKPFPTHLQLKYWKKNDSIIL